MEVLSIKKYNAMQTKLWEKRYGEVMDEVKKGNRHLTELPQLAFYIFDKSYGYVAFNHSKHKALWDKSKKGVVTSINK
jgi:hypothetical protein